MLQMLHEHDPNARVTFNIYTYLAILVIKGFSHIHVIDYDPYHTHDIDYYQTYFTISFD